MASTITATTLSGSINQNAQVLTVASATNLANPVAGGFRQVIYVINPDQTVGELMDVVGLNGTQVQVSRLYLSRQSFYTGSAVIIAPAPIASLGFGGNLGPTFYESDPVGDPSVSGSYPGAPALLPWLNVTNGNQFLQGINGQWVPGWNNASSVKGVTAEVASTAGAILPSGPLFHVTGTAAVTGFTIPVGFAGGSFTIIPDGNFTWTTAGNIALAGTAVTGRALTFTWDSAAAKFNPSYV